ncbi:MAG TPA: CBS domain-containing protein [Nitrososphaerales archaeon]|nr:CBS domain-containing protein [Nitrososphaerales archaeon]
MKPNKLAELPVTELLTPVMVIPSGDSASRVVGFFKETGHYEAFMEDGDNTAMVTVRDLLGVSDISKVKISSLMHQVPRLTPASTVGAAATLMHDYRIRSLPVYGKKTILGRISSASIVEKLLDTDIDLKVSSIMTPNPIRLDSSEKLSNARSLMARRKIDQLPVMEQTRLRGIVTSEQIVFNLMPWVDRNVKGDWRRRRFDTPLAMFASREVVTSGIIDPLKDVFTNMSIKKANYSVIMNLDVVQGIVTYRDFMKILTHHPAEDSPVYMVGLPNDPFEAGEAKSKFSAAVRLLRKTIPEITEARAVIKMGETKSPKKKYQVRILILSPERQFSYRIFSYELADAFDSVNDWVKRISSSHPTKSRRISEAPR